MKGYPYYEGSEIIAEDIKDFILMSSTFRRRRKRIKKYVFDNIEQSIQWEKDRDQLWVVAVGHRKNIYDRDL